MIKIINKETQDIIVKICKTIFKDYTLRINVLGILILKKKNSTIKKYWLEFLLIDVPIRISEILWKSADFSKEMQPELIQLFLQNLDESKKIHFLKYVLEKVTEIPKETLESYYCYNGLNQRKLIIKWNIEQKIAFFLKKHERLFKILDSLKETIITLIIILSVHYLFFR